MARDHRTPEVHDGGMFAPYCPTCNSRRLLGYGRIVSSSWHRGGAVRLRCVCGTIVSATARPPEAALSD
jgi:hypothetical protein